MSNKPKLLLIYTGGTIGMINDPVTNELKSFDFAHISKHVPEINRLNVSIDTSSFERPIDSSEINVQHWSDLAEQIYKAYDAYDGFVILHGSDTMAYTASALSYMLQGLRKPVILTGSQLPIGTIRTDGKENLITAIEIAADRDEQGEPRIQEVAVYFEYSLYRGNRSSKLSANQFMAFGSPNYAELAKAGVTITYNTAQLYRTELQALHFRPKMSTRVALLKLYPSFPAEAYASLFDRTYTDCIVLETFGSGNAPSNTHFQEAIQHYRASGGIILNTTQCQSGAVDQGKYETSSFFTRAGVISGRDITTEAAVTKCMHLLAHADTAEELVHLLCTNLCGEMTV